VIAINHTGDTGVMLHESRHAYHYLTRRITFRDGKSQPSNWARALDNEVSGYKIQYAYSGSRGIPNSRFGRANYMKHITTEWMVNTYRNGQFLYPEHRYYFYLNK
jgi:hypothetical protein